MRRLLSLAAVALLLGCGGRLTPPTVPAERLELDRLARGHAAGERQTEAQRRRLAVLLDRVDNAPGRADLIDGALETTRARQAWAWRGWSRQTSDWPARVVRAVGADPGDPGAAALLALLARAPAAAIAPHVATLATARGTMLPIARCITDGLLARAAGDQPLACSVEDTAAALASLAAADPAADPEADRLRWTLATWGPAPDPVAAADAAARWLGDWPRHADGWAMAGASAAADLRAAPAERLAWSGAAWQRAVALAPDTVRARLALARLEALHGFPAAAEAERQAARRAPGDADVAPDLDWAAPPPPALDPEVSDALSPAGPTAGSIAEGRDELPPLLLDRVVLTARVSAATRLARQRLGTAPFEWAPGCVERIHGPQLFEQICVSWVAPEDGAIELPLPTAAPLARAELVVETPAGATPRFESHGGAPGARVVEGPDGARHVFVMSDLDPTRDGPRRPRIRVRLGPGFDGPGPAPGRGMVERLVALESGDLPSSTGAEAAVPAPSGSATEPSASRRP